MHKVTSSLVWSKKFTCHLFAGMIIALQHGNTWDTDGSVSFTSQGSNSVVFGFFERTIGITNHMFHLKFVDASPEGRNMSRNHRYFDKRIFLQRSYEENYIIPARIHSTLSEKIYAIDTKNQLIDNSLAPREKTKYSSWIDLALLYWWPRNNMIYKTLGNPKLLGYNLVKQALNAWAKKPFKGEFVLTENAFYEFLAGYLVTWTNSLRLKVYVSDRSGTIQQIYFTIPDVIDGGVLRNRLTLTGVIRLGSCNIEDLLSKDNFFRNIVQYGKDSTSPEGDNVLLFNVIGDVTSDETFVLTLKEKFIKALSTKQNDPCISLSDEIHHHQNVYAFETIIYREYYNFISAFPLHNLTQFSAQLYGKLMAHSVVGTNLFLISENDDSGKLKDICVFVIESKFDVYIIGIGQNSISLKTLERIGKNYMTNYRSNTKRFAIVKIDESYSSSRFNYGFESKVIFDKDYLISRVHFVNRGSGSSRHKHLNKHLIWQIPRHFLMTIPQVWDEEFKRVIFETLIRNNDSGQTTDDSIKTMHEKFIAILIHFVVTFASAQINIQDSQALAFLLQGALSEYVGDFTHRSTHEIPEVFLKIFDESRGSNRKLKIVLNQNDSLMKSLHDQYDVRSYKLICVRKNELIETMLCRSGICKLYSYTIEILALILIIFLTL